MPGMMGAPMQNYGGPGSLGSMGGGPINGIQPNPVDNQYKLYNSGVAQNAEDYGSIMDAYKQFLSNQVPMMQAGTYNPTFSPYQQSNDVRQSMANMASLAASGGYSTQDLQDLRARAVSPVRAVYSNAQRNVDRSRALQGGYSPNYNAATAKMAREQSAGMADALTNANAGIAQNVASNKLQIAPQWGQLASSENQAHNASNMANANIANQAGQFNLQYPMQVGAYNQANHGQALQAINGMQSLYGTTPALANLYGSQASGAAQQQHNNQLQNQQQGYGFASSAMSHFG